MKTLIGLLKEAVIPKVLWHATPYDKFMEMVDQGQINTGSDGLLYFTDTPGGSARFIAFRGERRIVALPIKTSKLDKSKVKQSFDHNEEFWKTKAWYYPESIPFNKVDWDNIQIFEL